MAATGDPVYVKADQSDGLILTGAQKTALRNAVKDAEPDVRVVDIDEVVCATRGNPLRRSGCRVAETEDGITDARYYQLRKAGELSSSATSTHRRSRKLVRLSSDMLTAWNTFTQLAWGKNLQELYSMQCYRPEALDRTVIRCKADVITVGTKAQYRADDEAGQVAGLLGESP